MENEMKWHPCEIWDEWDERDAREGDSGHEGLPPRAGLYLVTVLCGRLRIVEVDELLPRTVRRDWNSPWSREDYGPVIAWAELPKPYRGVIRKRPRQKRKA